MSPEAMAAAIPTAGPIAAAVQAAPGGPDVGGGPPQQPSAPFVQPQHPSTMRYPMWPTPPAPAPSDATPPGSPSATPRPADSGGKGPLASPDAPAATPMKRRAGAANLGYYQPSNRFIGIAAPNASAQNSMRAGPQGTALNLAGLFGGRGQPAVNPNVPAANAQPVSAAGPFNDVGIRAVGPLPANAEGNAPWWMGPLQQGNIWRGSGGPRR